MFLKFYIKNGEYIYVECGKIDDFGLVRILVVVGVKNVVVFYVNFVVKKG